ncbi:YbhB/YbcL family Raf kinase inhibitor-like protein [Rhodococcus sp. NPDC057529]|uniref:YbhB/YbcL family Raf kinase inhibitor-like protein n=1 Tax=Rhodococcus sp. NPDC057529 TaxID=3346158 RepID=UPI0036718745
MKINKGTLSISSSAFEHGERMPDAHSKNGRGVSPLLSWTGVPEGTKSFALVVHDPDAPLIDGFTHWVLYGIPAQTDSVPEGGGTDYVQGVNSTGAPGWTPAAPPAGHGTHFYYFHLYALDAELDLPPGLSMAELLREIDPHVINQARVVGTYSNE